MSPNAWNYKGAEVLIRTTYLEEINRNRCFLRIEKDMFVTPVFYLGAVKIGRLRLYSTAVPGLLTTS
jgi:hypothetical protein